MTALVMSMSLATGAYAQTIGDSGSDPDGGGIGDGETDPGGDIGDGIGDPDGGGIGDSIGDPGVVPEPSLLGLSALGLTFIGYALYRKRK